MINKIPTQSEHDIQNILISYLWMKGYYAQRLNSGKIRTERGHMIQLMPPGTPDIMAFKRRFKKNTTIDHGTYATIDSDLDLLFIEVKKPGNKPTYLQTEKMKELEEFGARCFVTHSLEELKKQLVG